MSRIGRSPIELPAGVSVSISPGRVQVNGPLGELAQDVPQRMTIEQNEGVITVTRPTDRGEDRALHGLTRTLVANMVQGVTSGYEKRLEIQGVGYRASMRGTALELNVGFSHSVVKDAPAGITYELPSQTEIVVKGIDKQQVGQIAAEIRKVRPPEPYKGKGIRYQASTCAEGREESVSTATTRQLRERRRRRIRGKVAGTAERPRLAVFRSNLGIAAQLIDDQAGSRSPPRAGSS
jgi:large subunit ribosomal protein L6